MASAAAGRRGAPARAAQAAAKQRRQTIVAAVLGALLLALLAYQIPHLLKRSGAGTASPVAAAPAAPPPTTRHASAREGGSRRGADPFAARSVPNRDARAAAAGGPDPFTAPAAPAPAALPAPARAVPSPAPAALPKQIVLGRPGGHRVARHGWIVILASIRSTDGRDQAARFARSARANVGPLSILNSSTSAARFAVATGSSTRGHSRRCQRSLGTQATSTPRATGTPYIRELIAYR